MYGIPANRKENTQNPRQRIRRKRGLSFEQKGFRGRGRIRPAATRTIVEEHKARNELDERSTVELRTQTAGEGPKPKKNDGRGTQPGNSKRGRKGGGGGTSNEVGSGTLTEINPLGGEHPGEVRIEEEREVSEIGGDLLGGGRDDSNGSLHYCTH